MIELQVFDAIETRLVVGTESSVQAIEVWGVDSQGERRRIVVKGTPHEIYADADQVEGSMNDLLRDLNEHLLRRQGPCRRTGCETCGAANDKFITYEPCATHRATDAEAACDIDVVHRRGFEVYDENERPFYRIRLTRSYYAIPAKRYLESKGVDVYECCPKAVESFVRLKNVQGFGWYRAPSEECMFDEFVPIDRHDLAPFKHVIFDIETISEKYNDVESERGEYPVGCIVSTDGSAYTAYMFGDKVEDYVEPDPTKHTTIKYFDRELDMLRAFRDEQIKPAHVLSGYDSDRFDIPYVFRRARRLGDLEFNKLAPNRVMRFSMDKHPVHGKIFKVHCPGVVCVDYLKMVRKDVGIKPLNYKLETVARDVFKLGEKGDLPYEHLFASFYGSPKRRGELLSYCAQDVYLTHAIGRKMGILHDVVAKCLVKRVLPRDEMYRGQSFCSTRKVKSYIKDVFLMLSPQEEYIDGHTEKKLPRAFQEIVGYIEKVYKKKYPGGYVRKPIHGTHLGFKVATLDFNSLYPSIIRQYNICRSTQLRRIDELPPEKVWVSDLGFGYAQHREGVIPRIMREMVDERNAVKAKMKKCTDPDEKSRLNAYQNALKIVANGLYGLMGADTSDLVNKAAAASVCARGAYLAKTACEMITAKFGEEFGLRVIYGDTDSLMMEFQKSTGAEQTYEWLQRVSQFINKDCGLLTGHLKMGMEDVCCILLLKDKKKHYVKYKRCVENGHMEEPEMKYSGIINRSKTQHVIDGLKEMYQAVMIDQRDITDIYVRLVREVAEGRVDRSRLVHTANLKDDVELYHNEPHAVAARQMKHAGLPVKAGDRISYYFCMLTGRDKSVAAGVVAEPFAHMYDLDWRTYTERTIMALSSVESSIRNAEHWTKPSSYSIKGGTWKAPPEQGSSALVGKPDPRRKQVVPVQSRVGSMDRFVSRGAKRARVEHEGHDFDAMLGDDDVLVTTERILSRADQAAGLKPVRVQTSLMDIFKRAGVPVERASELVKKQKVSEEAFDEEESDDAGEHDESFETFDEEYENSTKRSKDGMGAAKHATS